jgi:hypothetical protein
MTPDRGVLGQDGRHGFVVSSEVTISPESAETLERSFRERLHMLVSWWDDADSFRRYMRSAEHRISHARIPHEPDKPRGTGVRRYVLLPDS